MKNYTAADVINYISKNYREFFKKVLEIKLTNYLKKNNFVKYNLLVIEYLTDIGKFVIKFDIIKTDNTLTTIKINMDDGFSWSDAEYQGIKLYLNCYLTDGIAYEDVINDDLEAFVYGCAHTRVIADEKLDKVIGLPTIKTRYGDILDYTKWKKIVQLRLMYYLFKIIKLLFEGNYNFVDNIKTFHKINVESTIHLTLRDNTLVKVEVSM